MISVMAAPVAYPSMRRTIGGAGVVRHRLYAFAPGLYAFAPGLYAFAPGLYAFAPWLYAFAPGLYAFALVRWRPASDNVRRQGW